MEETKNTPLDVRDQGELNKISTSQYLAEVILREVTLHSLTQSTLSEALEIIEEKFYKDAMIAIDVSKCEGIYIKDATVCAELN